MLSRVNINNLPKDESDYEPDINNKNIIKIGALNSNHFVPKEYAKCNIDSSVEIHTPSVNLDLNTTVEQEEDDKIMALKIVSQYDKLLPFMADKFVIIDDVIFYISNADTDPILRLYVHSHLRHEILVQYHEGNGHIRYQIRYLE